MKSIFSVDPITEQNLDEIEKKQEQLVDRFFGFFSSNSENKNKESDSLLKQENKIAQKNELLQQKKIKNGSTVKLETLDQPSFESQIINKVQSLPSSAIESDFLIAASGRSERAVLAIPNFTSNLNHSSPQLDVFFPGNQ